MDTTHYLSPGLEATRVDEMRITMALYGSRFTVNDQDELVFNLLRGADAGLNVGSFESAHAHRYSSEAISEAVDALSRVGVLTTRQTQGQNLAAAAQFEHVRHLARDSLQGTESLDPAHWQLIITGEGKLAAALEAHLLAMGIPTLALLAHELLPDVRAERCLVVHCADSERIADARRRNLECVTSHQSSLHLCVDNGVVRCGPLVVPGANACYECFYHRVRATRRFAEEFTARSEDDKVLVHASATPQAIQWAVAEGSRVILSYLSGAHDELHLSPISEINTSRGEIHKSRLLRLPRCPVCGNGSGMHPLTPVFDAVRARSAVKV